MKVVLSILPYWPPVMPPIGLARLKGYLAAAGHQVKIVDLITKNESLIFYYNYFDALGQFLPAEKHANYKTIGHELLHHHMLAYVQQHPEQDYFRLVKLLVNSTYYVDLDDTQIHKLNSIVAEFFDSLVEYFQFLLEFETPDVLGVTVYKGTLAASLFVLKYTREHFPHIKTVMEGSALNTIYAPGTPNFARIVDYSRDFVDKIFIGEEAQLFLAYAQGQLDDSRRIYTLEDSIAKTIKYEPFGFPDFSGINLRKYSYLPATASSGDPASTTQGTFLRRDIEKTVAEMITLFHTVETNRVKQGHQLFFFTDTQLNPSISELAQEIRKQEAPLYFDGYYQIDEDSTQVENTTLWRHGGLYRVRLNIGTGSARLLAQQQKDLSPSLVHSSITAFAAAGVKTSTYWHVGYPGETEADFLQTLDLLSLLKESIYQADCTFFDYSAFAAAGASTERLVPFYPEWARQLMLLDSWWGEVSRQVAFERLIRFFQHCAQLGIPNPHSFAEIAQADLRWQSLHPSAVPPMGEFSDPYDLIKVNRQKHLTVGACSIVEKKE